MKRAQGWFSLSSVLLAAGTLAICAGAFAVQVGAIPPLQSALIPLGVGLVALSEISELRADLRNGSPIRSFRRPASPSRGIADSPPACAGSTPY